MNLRSIVRITLLATALLGAHASAAVLSTPVGTPAWQPLDFHLYTAPVGPAPNFPDYFQSLLNVLPEPNHRAHPDLGVGPGDPHAGPYTNEIATGVARQAIDMAIITRWRMPPEN